MHTDIFKVNLVTRVDVKNEFYQETRKSESLIAIG